MPNQPGSAAVASPVAAVATGAMLGPLTTGDQETVQRTIDLAADLLGRGLATKNPSNAVEPRR